MLACKFLFIFHFYLLKSCNYSDLLLLINDSVIVRHYNHQLCSYTNKTPKQKNELSKSFTLFCCSLRFNMENKSNVINLSTFLNYKSPKLQISTYVPTMRILADGEMEQCVGRNNMGFLKVTNQRKPANCFLSMKKGSEKQFL